MSSRDLEKLSGEDLQKFEEYLEKRYQTVDHGYAHLRGLLQKFCRSARLTDFEDLVDDVLSRIIWKFIDFDNRGETIANLEAFARQVTQMLMRERARKAQREVELEGDDSAISDPSKRFNFRYRVDREIEALIEEIKQDCLEACLQKLTTQKRALFKAYYPDYYIHPKQLAKLRMNLALKEAGVCWSEDPEQNQRHLGTLQVKISKLRSKLAALAKGRLEQRMSSDLKLAQLEQQEGKRAIDDDDD